MNMNMNEHYEYLQIVLREVLSFVNKNWLHLNYTDVKKLSMNAKNVDTDHVHKVTYVLHFFTFNNRVIWKYWKSYYLLPQTHLSSPIQV
jgi:hypothetical protein